MSAGAQGRLEGALTRGKSMKDDMAAVLGGLRDGRGELVQALEGDPAAAAELAARGADAAVEVRGTRLRPPAPAPLQPVQRSPLAYL